MGFDKHLFLMYLQESDLVDLTPYYKSMLEAWKVFTVSRSPDLSAGTWLLEEPLFFNPLFPSRLLSSACLRSRLLAAGYTKLGHVLNSSVEVITQRTKVKSARMIQQLVAEVHGTLRKEH